MSCAGEAPNKLATRGQPARRGGKLALLFLVQKRCPTNSQKEVGWRTEASWPYHFLCSRHEEDAEEEEEKDAKLKSYYPNTDGYGTVNADCLGHFLLDYRCCLGSAL